jgi:uncharacterized damage-inducible protein DinB
MNPVIDKRLAVAEVTSLSGELLRLVDHSTWANREWIEFVYSQPDPETRPLELLSHVMLGERVWFDRIAGRPEPQSTFPTLAREELLRGLDENGQTYRSLVAGRLDDVVHFTRASGEKYHARVIDILHHLISHGYHHRGQLAAHYARKGVPYPNTDHINFLIENQL